MRLFTKVFAIAFIATAMVVTSTSAAANTSHLSRTDPRPPLLSTTTLKPPKPIVKTTTTTVHHQIVQPKRIQRRVFASPKPMANYRYLAPCIVAYESGSGIIGNKNYLGQNPISTASGEAQWLDSTWNNYYGYTRAKYAPPRIQDQRLMEDLSLPLSHIQREWAAQRSRCHF